MSKIKIRCEDGFPFATKAYINNKEVQNLAIVRYKYTKKEDRLIVVTYLDLGGEKQKFFSRSKDKFDFVLYNCDKTFKILVNDHIEVYQNDKQLDLKNLSHLIWESELPDLCAFELKFY